jgi:hypothetical protein
MDNTADSVLRKKRGNPDEPEPGPETASEEKRQAVEIPLENIDLTKYIETRYVSKNKNLKKILFPLVNKFGISANKFIGYIESMIRSNDWKSFDGFCEANKGVENFWDILQCLFYLRYFAKYTIDFDQMQKAMGIQQARWSVDPANECYQELLQKNKNYYAKNIVGFAYFTDFLEEYQNNFVNDIFNIAVPTKYRFQMRDELWEYIKKMRAESEKPGFIGNVEEDIVNPLLKNSKNFELNMKKQIKDLLSDRIFYKIPEIRTQYEFGDDKQPFLCIPQTYDLTSIKCFHKPILVFGALNPKTMVNFVISTNMRPFAAHLPGSTANLQSFDGIDGGILHNWRHDFNHQRFQVLCDLNETIQRAKIICPGDGDLPKENDGPEAWLDNERFQKCLDTQRDHTLPRTLSSFDDPLFFDESTKTAEAFIDFGSIFKKGKRPTYLLGGKKTKRRRNRKTRGKKQKRSRKHR